MTDGNPAEPTRDGIARTESLGNIRIFIEALERLGYDGDGVLQAIQLRRSDLNDPDGRVPCSLVGAMFGRALQKRPLKNLGTRIAAETPIGAFPLIDYLVLTSESVGQGLKKLSQYFRLVDFPVFLNIQEEESSVQILYEGPPSPFGFESESAFAFFISVKRPRINSTPNTSTLFTRLTTSRKSSAFWWLPLN
jgi:Arabinose-binding domain of AraC transcription regulator, N-term